MLQGKEAKKTHETLDVDPPPSKKTHETPRKQTSDSNSNSNSVLVATDAIGMGLNLNIKRIIFTSMTKFDGKERRKLYPAEVKQIAGRAGRYSGDYSSGGIVTTLHPEDLSHLHICMGTPDLMISHAGVCPTFEHLQLLYILMSHHWSRRDLLHFHEVSVGARAGGGRGSMSVPSDAHVKLISIG